VRFSVYPEHHAGDNTKEGESTHLSACMSHFYRLFHYNTRQLSIHEVIVGIIHSRIVTAAMLEVCNVVTV